MAKNLKINIKNTQLAAALKTKQKASSSEESPTTIEQESQKKLSRLKEDAALSTSPRQNESASKETETGSSLPKKRKSRIVQVPTTPSAEEELPMDPPSHATIQEETPSAEPVENLTEASTPSSPPEPETPPAPTTSSSTSSPPPSPAKPPLPVKKEVKELKSLKKKEESRFDARDRQGLRDIDNEGWRKKRIHKPRRSSYQEETIRPKNLSIRVPITIKDLAQEMKLKASQLVAKLFMQGVILTLNDALDDETTIQLLGHEFDCRIEIDRSEEERLQITKHSIQEEIRATSPDQLTARPPIIAFMGHVDHGKTSLIDTIRKSNRAAGEAGAITQHIGAFQAQTSAGTLTILDTPGHEAFSEMRSRGAHVTDVVVLVVAGDEGVRAQTKEAVAQAKEANVPILVAINKSDKPNFDAQSVYRELADLQLLPEAWGGTTITVNCSATTGEGIQELLEMLSLQAEILELRAQANARARGTILESEMHKGLGAVATILVQNGTLRKGDAIVYSHYSGRIKTMQDDQGRSIEEALPSVPVKITGLSELALAGSEFIVVKNEKEARALAAAREEGRQRTQHAKPKIGGLEKMLAQKESGEKKILPLILRADVQGSLEALKTSLLKIDSNKVRLEIVSADVGEISESDIELAYASKATLLGFHTSIESHAETLIKQKNIPVYTHDVIYHLIDEVRNRMRQLLDKVVEETDTGMAVVKTIFKSSLIGNIAGCQVAEGTIKRQHFVRQIRDGQVIWKGKIASLKRMKEDVKEVHKGFECGILLEGRSDLKEEDLLQAYELTYLEQDL